MPWQKGQSGNPKGRPMVRNSLAETIRQLLETKEKGTGKTHNELILLKAAEMAEEGSIAHANFLYSFGYGKPAETVNLGGGLSLYEKGASEAERIASEAGMGALLKHIKKLAAE